MSKLACFSCIGRHCNGCVDDPTKKNKKKQSKPEQFCDIKVLPQYWDALDNNSYENFRIIYNNWIKALMGAGAST